MGHRACVFAGVAIRRRVATERDAACLARSQMDPGRADFHALVALMRLWMLHCVYRLQVRTGLTDHGNVTAILNSGFAILAYRFRFPFEISITGDHLDRIPTIDLSELRDELPIPIPARIRDSHECTLRRGPTPSCHVRSRSGRFHL